MTENLEPAVSTASSIAQAANKLREAERPVHLVLCELELSEGGQGVLEATARAGPCPPPVISKHMKRLFYNPH